MNWCLFIFFISFRFLNYVVAHGVWIFTLYMGCIYYQVWKSYDIVWMWAHLVLCICLPKLRSDNIFIIACRLMIRRFRETDKSCRELFRDLWDDEKVQQLDVETESPSDSAKADSNRLAAAVSLGLFYLRIRVSFAMLVGNVHHALFSPKPETVITDWNPGLSNVFRISIFIDIFFLWGLLFWAAFRQCRLCCLLGCCRFYLWVLLVLVIGLVSMEGPMWYLYDQLDVSWCTFAHIPSTNSTKSG